VRRHRDTGGRVATAEEDNGKWVPVIAFECRGLEPVAYHPEVRGICWLGAYEQLHMTVVHSCG
jgi:hypothetical protein